MVNDLTTKKKNMIFGLTPMSPQNVAPASGLLYVEPRSQLLDEWKRARKGSCETR